MVKGHNFHEVRFLSQRFQLLFYFLSIFFICFIGFLHHLFDFSGQTWIINLISVSSLSRSLFNNLVFFLPLFSCWLTFLLRGLLLAELCIGAIRILIHKFLVIAHFCKSSINQDDDLVSILYCRQSVCNNNNSDWVLLSVIVNGSLHNTFIYFVQCRGGFV